MELAISVPAQGYMITTSDCPEGLNFSFLRSLRILRLLRLIPSPSLHHLLATMRLAVINTGALCLLLLVIFFLMGSGVWLKLILSDTLEQRLWLGQCVADRQEL